MKYSPESYAKAFATCHKDAPTPKEEDALIRRFLETIRKNGDLPFRAKIVAATERAVRRTQGGRNITATSARALEEKTRARIEKTKRPDDALEFKTAPELIAGVIVTINDEERYDGSLAKKLTILFREK